MAAKRIALKLNEWPAQDRAAWQAALVPGDLFDAGGPASNWAPSTQSGVSTGYGRWLAWLTSLGPLVDDQTPAARVTAEAIIGYVAYLRTQRATSSAGAYLAFLVMALKAIEPDRDWSWLQRIVARLKMLSTPARDKRPRLQDTDDLFAYGLELIEKAEISATAGALPGVITWECATQYRDGLMLALLAVRPFRRKNFCAIQIGQHLLHQKGRYGLIFEGCETKSGQPLQQPFPPELVAGLERYLACYRPWLCRQTSNRDPRFPFKPAGQHLWVSKTGSALSPEIFYKNLRRRTAARFGRSVHPHLFRDCAATTIATHDPEHVRITMNILGHRSMQMSERHYNHAQSVQAAGRLQDNILKLRRAAQRTARVRPNGQAEQEP